VLHDSSKIPRLSAGLVAAVALFFFFFCHGCTGTEVHRQNSVPLLIHLAAGAFDPLSVSDPIVLPRELKLRKYPEGEVGYYIVQFKGPVQEKWKKAVVSAGARLFDYIPQFAFIAKMDHQTREAIRAMPSVRWIGIYQPGYRIAPDLVTSLSEKSDQPADVMVSVFKGEDVSNLVSEVNRLGGRIVKISEGSGRIRVRVFLKRIIDLARLTGVKWIERAPEMEIFPAIKRRLEE